MDSIVYQITDVLTAMQADAGMALGSIKADGGASANNYLMQTQADISGAAVQRPRCVETTALGAAYLAGLAVGYWKDMDDIRSNWSCDRTFTPELADDEVSHRLHLWKKAVACAKGWAE
jgi:glycerol kinase